MITGDWTRLKLSPRSWGCAVVEVQLVAHRKVVPTLVGVCRVPVANLVSKGKVVPTLVGVCRW